MKKNKEINFHWLVLSFVAGLFMTFTGCSDSFQDLGPDPTDTFVKFHGGGYVQEAADLQPKGNGFLLLGTTFTASLGQDGQLYLVETDEGGNEINTNIIETGIPNATGSANSLSATGDGFLLSGTITYQGGHTDGWLVKVDENLNSVWTYVYGDPMFNETAMAAVETAAGEVFLLGTTTDVDLIKGKGDTLASDDMDMLLVKIDPSNLSEPMWEKTYGYTGLDEGSDILDLENGTLALLGTTDYPEGGSLDKDVLVVVVNEDGNVTNARNFGEPDKDEIASRMDLTPGGNLAITGKSSSGEEGDVLFLTVDQSMELITPPVAIRDPDGFIIDGNGMAITSIDDDNFIITGLDAVFLEETDLLLIKVDGSGNLTLGPLFFGEGDKDSGVCVLPQENRIVILGTLSLGSNTMMGLIKTNEFGELDVIQ